MLFCAIIKVPVVFETVLDMTSLQKPTQQQNLTGKYLIMLTSVVYIMEIFYLLLSEFYD